MAKKTVLQDPFQPKITRNDRFAQMSHQEKVIEQKKKELLAKREATQKSGSDVASTSAAVPVAPAKHAKSSPKVTSDVNVKKIAGFNLFNNDGSFLDTFKQLKEKKSDSKGKSFKSRESYEKNYCDQRGNKNSRWSQKRRSPSPKGNTKTRVSRFSDKSAVFEPLSANKITINTHSFNSPVQSQHSFDHQQQHQTSISPQNVTGQPLLKNILPPPGMVYPAVTQQSSSGVIAAPPLLLNVPPPQMVQSQVNSALLVSNPSTNMLVSTPAVVTLPASSAVLTTVTLPPPPIQTISVPTTNNTISVPPPTAELTSIPPPNPIQVQNIPQPEPINALNIPHPAPIQVQNIPTPTSMQLNEIPNPKPLDLLTIPTPNDDNQTKSMSDPDFIKNIPPPNKSVPPPSLSETNISVPPPSAAAISLPPPIIAASIPPPVSQPLTQNLTVQSMTAPCQNILVHTLPPPQPVPPQIQTMQSLQATQSIQNIQTGIPPPNLQVASISVALPVGVVPSSPVNVNNTIPSLMAQPILPPPGMGVTTVNMSCPPPLLHINAPNNPTAMQVAPPPPPSFVNHPPPITNQMPPMNVPPPQTAMPIMGASTSMATASFRDMNAGTSDYEAMASLGRMVAEFGTGIEDVVRQRKPQDPNLWFLFHKESAAYQQYQQLLERFKREMSEGSKDSKYKPEDIYEPEMSIDDDCDFVKHETKQELEFDESGYNKRKRKSRWGDKDTTVPPPKVVLTKPLSNLPHAIVPIQPVTSGGSMMLSKVTRTDPGLLQYALNTYGSANLTDEEWKKAEDHYKINLLYQDMLKKKEAREKLQQAGKHKYDYDSDEDVDGGTWEHKLRDKEMMATQLWAQELTRQAEGKHHIGDFLPPDEYKRFMEKTNANKEGRTPNFSDYKEFKIKEDNIGFQLLQKLGWTEGQGLGSNGSGIIEPINKSGTRDHQGLGLGESDSDKEDEYEAYRKRMMLAYRFRPNPLNNPRRPYY